MVQEITFERCVLTIHPSFTIIVFKALTKIQELNSAHEYFVIGLEHTQGILTPRFANRKTPDKPSSTLSPSNATATCEINNRFTLKSFEMFVVQVSVAVNQRNPKPVEPFERDRSNESSLQKHASPFGDSLYCTGSQPFRQFDDSDYFSDLP